MYVLHTSPSSMSSPYFPEARQDWNEDALEISFSLFQITPNFFTAIFHVLERQGAPPHLVTNLFCFVGTVTQWVVGTLHSHPDTIPESMFYWLCCKATSWGRSDPGPLLFQPAFVSREILQRVCIAFGGTFNLLYERYKQYDNKSKSSR